jgi:WD40 repeat protein
VNRITLTLPAPYVGLRPFTEKDALLFFGRQTHVADLLRKLEGRQRFIAVVGASGTGKSSLVRAGLVPALHRGALASAGHRWSICVFKPGDAPLDNLAQALTEDPRWIDNGDRATSVSSLRSTLAVSPLALTAHYRDRAALLGGEALLLVVDQFEEIFRYRQRNADDAEAFIRLLLRSASEEVPIYLVITMRADFLGNCVAFAGLPEAINTGIYLTPRLGPEDLKSVIASPLALVNGEIDPVLVSRLINVLGAEDELPVLEHALLRMWSLGREQGRTKIETSDFEAVCASRNGSRGAAQGQVALQPMLAHAIDNHASELYDGLTRDRQSIARQVFLALVERREGRDVRRPQTVGELADRVGGEAEHATAVIDAFRAEGVGFLLPPKTEVAELLPDTTIDISHESLFRRWHLFQTWLGEEDHDVAELYEWQQRASRQQEGGGWLDENDTQRALRWQDRVRARGYPEVWADRYGGMESYTRVNGYIQASLARQRAAQVERARLEQEANAARIQSLELDARLQREIAERAAEDTRKAKQFAEATRKRSRVALATSGLAVSLMLLAATFWREAASSRDRAEQLATTALSGELVATAENLASESPDQSLLLSLAAARVARTIKTDAQIRLARGRYLYNAVLRGHEGRVLTAAWSPDGRTFVTGGDDRTARVWDAATGRVLHVLRGHERAVQNAMWAPDGRTIITTGGDETARLWDAATGQPLHVLSGHEGWVNTAAWAPDGKTIVTVSLDQTARTWETATGKELLVLRGHQGPVTGAAWAPNGKAIVTVSGDRTARIWAAATGKQVQVLRGHASVLSASWAPDSQAIVTAGDQTAWIWNASTGKALRALRGDREYIFSASWSPDGKSILTAVDDRTARVWDAVTGKVLQTLRGHEDGISGEQWAPGGRMIVTTSRDETARVWDSATGKVLWVLLGHEGRIATAAWATDGRKIVTASDDGTARLWHASAATALHTLQGQEGATSQMAWAPDGRTIVTASRDRTARVWDAATGKALRILSGHGDAVISVEWALDGKRVVTVSDDGTARIWDAATGNTMQVLHGHGVVKTAAWAPDGRTIVTASGDGTARVWDTESGKSLHLLEGQKGMFLEIAAWAPDGKTIVTADLDMTARIWDAASGKQLQVLRGHESTVRSAAWAPDSKMIVTAGFDGTARIWETATGKELQVLRGHDDGVFSVAWAPDGRSIVTASPDRSARVWDAATGKAVHVLRGHEGPVLNATWARDGRTILTSSSDGTARLWDAATGGALLVLRGHHGPVLKAAWAPDGKTFVTADAEGTVRVWACVVCRPVDEIAAELSRIVARQLTTDECRRFGVPESACTGK